MQDLESRRKLCCPRLCQPALLIVPGRAGAVCAVQLNIFYTDGWKAKWAGETLSHNQEAMQKGSTGNVRAMQLF